VFEVSVLGPVEVRRDGLLVPVPGGRTAELLVRLALEAGLSVRAERLLDDLWGDDAVTTRRNTLQSKVTRLRRALGDPLAIAGGDGGYRLAVEPSAVDALAVLGDVGAAAALLDAEDDRGAAELTAAALSRYRGDILPSAGDGDWVGPHRARLDEARAKLVETGLSARLRLGEGGDVIGELEAAVATYPYREGLWELLITALYRAGRQADALAAYQRVRGRLADDLGLDPGPGLRTLERQVLAHDPALGRPRRVAPPRAEPGPPAGNLPALSAELVGREAEIAAVGELLAHERLVEIVGPGGIGKTALVIAVARALAAAGALAPGGIWLARLESARTADEVLDTLIAAMGVTGGEAALFERLRRAAAIVVLDNCEHVLDAAAALAVGLLDGAPGLRILCTSQAPLDVEGEALFELAPLALADAMELFARRARRSDPADGAARDATRDLCRSLDGLPLAIELAAARTRTLSIEEITRRLDDRFSVLSDPASRRPQRRRALKATIGWSYDLLFPDDQRGLWALATFAGGAPLAAVEAVLAALDVPASATIDVVGRLASRSLVIVDQVGGSEKDRLRNLGGGAAGPVRYRLLDSIRAFALDAMSEAGLTERALSAHAAWFAAAAGSSTAGVRGARQAEHLAFARDERANIDAALDWSAAHDPLLALAIVDGFGWAWIVLGDSRGAQRILAALAAAGDAAPPHDRACALLLAAWIEASTGRLELAGEHIASATELAGATGDVDLQARCCYHLAYVVSHRGEWSRALELTDRSDALYEGLDRPWDQAANWLFASRAAISARDRGRAVAARDRVAHWLRRVDDPWLHVRGEAMLGELARIELRFEDAVRHLARAARTSGRLGFLQTEAYQLSSLGRAQCQAGDYAAGAATLAIAIAKAEATGDVRLAALARVHLGRVLRALGRGAAARAALEAAAAWHGAAGGGEQAALGDCLLAALDASDGVAGAQRRLAAVLDAARAAEDAPVEVFALDALARIAAGTGDVARARELCETADRRMDAASHFITERDRTDARAVRQIA
jgi:predicted ATPase/DNA-binding SARP family transcriptional activator